MRILQAIFPAITAGIVAAACTVNENDCARNVELACHASASGGSDGPGGSGGGAPCDEDGTCKELGADCQFSAECRNGLCVDGVCCDTACNGLCEACNLPGMVGMCMPLPLGAIDSAVVDGKSCGPESGGCGAAPGHCRCDDGVKNGDEADVDCGGSCSNKCGTGSTCKALNGSDCVSSHCVDGYCCNTECDGACEACDAPDHPGLCLPVAPGSKDVQCVGSAVCGTSGVCAKANFESCSSDAQCASNSCKGNPPLCRACVADGDCASGEVCVNQACFDKAADGDWCQADAACAAGHCVDGVCCVTSCDGTCMGCHVNYTGEPSGTCAPIVGPAQKTASYDPHNECAGAGEAAACSGALAVDGNSSCGKP